MTSVNIEAVLEIKLFWLSEGVSSLILLTSVYDRRTIIIVYLVNISIMAINTSNLI